MSSQVPLLTEDGTRLDWSGALYEPRIDRRGTETKVTVEHILKGAAPLADAVRRGEAVWQTELRCPRLLFSEHFTSSDDRQFVEWGKEQVDWENMFLLPGMASVTELHLAPDRRTGTGEAVSDAVVVPSGALLAKADVRRLKPLMQSLLRLKKDDTLDDGQMKVEEDTTSDDPCFVVRIAEDVYAESCLNRDRLVAALIGAFASMSLKDSHMQPGGQLWDHPVSKELRDILLEAGSATWDEDDFNCVYAATLFEPLKKVELRVEGDED